MFDKLDNTALSEDDKEQEDDSKLIAVSLSDLLTRDLPPREYLLEPWLPKSGLCMVYAERGVGKTFFALEVTVAVAYGLPFLSFNAPRPARVLYIDGEMPANTMQERLISITNRVNPINEGFDPFFITPDLQKRVMPNLGNINDHILLDEYTEQADLVVIDNLSTLNQFGKENDSESWEPMQKLALKLRRKGKSVLFIHHASRNGTARGTSKREDILDTLIHLRHPGDYTPSKGACFEIHYEKTRSMMGDSAEPLLCQLTEKGWDYESITKDTNNHKIIALHNEGLKQKDIREKLDISKSHVSKVLSRARKEGKLID